MRRKRKAKAKAEVHWQIEVSRYLLFSFHRFLIIGSGQKNYLDTKVQCVSKNKLASYLGSHRYQITNSSSGGEI